jgi:ketosteroid isomerase-like protein
MEELIMKKLFSIIAALFFLTFVSYNNVFAGDDSDAFKAAVKEIFDVYSTANVKGDIDGWIALWDEKGIKMSPNRPSIYGKSAISDLKHRSADKREYITQSIMLEDAQVAGDFGFAHGTYTTSYKPKGAGVTMSKEGKFLTIFKKQANGSWKIFRDSVSSNAPPK